MISIALRKRLGLCFLVDVLASPSPLRFHSNWRHLSSLELRIVLPDDKGRITPPIEISILFPLERSVRFLQRDLPAQLRAESDSMLTSVDAAVTRSVVTKATEGEGAEDIEAVPLSGYWSRGWVLQELFLGKGVTVVCGRDEVPLQQFFMWDSLAFKHGE